jgi:uncharacterized protein
LIQAHDLLHLSNVIEPAEKPVRAVARVISGCEFLFGAAIVIGHNVYRVLPNEVPILFVLGLVSVRIREGRWSAIGFKRPESWSRIVWIALAAAVFRLLLGALIIEPLTSYFWPPIHAPAGTEKITGNISAALLTLLIVWTFAAFGEEISYRGYLTRRAADLGGRSTAAWWIATVTVSVLFGYGHYYKGPAGILDSGIAGLILGSAYLLAGRNLWAPVLGHGFIDTIALILTFLGWNR